MNTPQFQMRKMQRMMIQERDYKDGLERELASKMALISKKGIASKTRARNICKLPSGSIFTLCLSLYVFSIYFVSFIVLSVIVFLFLK